MSQARLWVFLSAAILTSVFFLNLCDAIFDCGCRSAWAGADAHCNYRNAGAGHHRCPWCQMGLVGGVALWGCIVFTQWWVSGITAKYGVISMTAMTLLAFPLTGGFLGLAAGWLFGYWS